MQTYTDQLWSLLSEHDRALDALADKIRTEVVTPFCRKYRVTYTSGMGTFFFSKGDRDYHCRDDMPKGPFGREMQVILELLDTEVAYNDCLGYRVGDV